MTATCPYCADELDVPAEFAGREVRCGNCQGVFAPPDDGGSKNGGVEPRRSRERLRQPEPSRSNAGVWGLGILTLIVTAPCTVAGVWLVVTVAFPDFQPVTDETGRYQAAFPGPAVPVNRKDDDGRLVRGFDLHRSFPPETYFVYYLDLPRAAARNPQTVLEDAAKKVEDFVPPGSKEVRREQTTHDGHPALDLMLENNDPQAPNVIVRLVLAKSPGGIPRLYVVGLSGQIPPHDPRSRRFFGAFKVSDGK